ncbi:MAG TPA: hypothetical protein VJV79_04525 [Polyangiaceae bacterium]|nr:hypothetical protein [Polyangiaceae bacterium]
MSSPIVIHMHRPYASEEEYIAHERYSIEAKSMLLIDQPALPLDTSIVFDVTLDNGQKPIRAEAKVIGYVEPEGDRPGGLRVRFRRFGSATKAFIDRAVNGEAAVVAPVAPVTPAALAVEAAEPTANVATTHSSATARTNENKESEVASGIHRKAVVPVTPPANREALLARLRNRRVG